ncbi:MAG: hypothetical protein V3T77_07255 [Planctomycetota bacterium]
MKPRQPVYIAGGAHTPFLGKGHPDFIWKQHPDYGHRDNPTLEELIHRVTREAFSAVGIRPSHVDCGFVGNFAGELFARQGHLGAILAGVHPDLAYKPYTRVEGASASGALALIAGVDAIASGANVVLVVGAEIQTSHSAKVGADYLARATHYERERALDSFTFPCLFARRAKAYFERYTGTPEDLTTIVRKAYGNAAQNPYAHMQAVMLNPEGDEIFLENPEYRYSLRASDCSPLSDGASCVILVSSQGLQRIGVAAAECVEMVSFGHTTGPLGEVQDLTHLDVTTAAAQRAYVGAGWNATDIEVAELHDCFSIAEILQYEALGFCRAGEGLRLAREGSTSRDGSIPVNCGGGLLGFGHPPGATGVKQALEIFRQMNGLCGDYQLPSLPVRGLSASMGGDDRTAVVILYRKV